MVINNSSQIKSCYSSQKNIIGISIKAYEPYDMCVYKRTKLPFYSEEQVLHSQ